MQTEDPPSPFESPISIYDIWKEKLCDLCEIRGNIFVCNKPNETSGGEILNYQGGESVTREK